MLNLLKEYRGIILNSAVEPEPPFLDGAEKQQATPTPVQAQPIFMRFSESTHFKKVLFRVVQSNILDLYSMDVLTRIRIWNTDPTHTGTSFYWLILA